MRRGDVVRLKSGGPPMTVTRGPSELVMTAELVWIHEGEYRRAEIHEDALDLVPNFSATSSAPMPADETDAAELANRSRLEAKP